MKQTQKYSKARHRLTFSHNTQDELYTELNRLGWYWDSKKQEWERDDRPAKESNNLIKIRVWAASEKVSLAGDLIVECCQSVGLKLIDKSMPYGCRPPNQNESRIYLTFLDDQEE